MLKTDPRHYFFGGQLLASAVWRAPKPCGGEKHEDCVKNNHEPEQLPIKKQKIIRLSKKAVLFFKLTETN